MMYVNRRMYWNAIANFHFWCYIRLGNAKLKLRIPIKSNQISKLSNFLYFGIIYTHEDALKFWTIRTIRNTIARDRLNYRDTHGPLMGSIWSKWVIFGESSQN